jgi:GAF domain-containing protein
MIAARPTLRALVQAAVEATGADRGWLLAAGAAGADSNDGAFTVAAAFGHDAAAASVGATRARRGSAAFAFASGQPAATRPRPDDLDNHGAGGTDGVPFALLVVPCMSDDVHGVLELVDPSGGAFGFDDVETASLLADIAGAALAEPMPTWEPPSPERLVVLLSSLASRDPARYAEVARFVEAMT